MADRKYYVFCDHNCRFEGMTREQIIAAIAEATGATPANIDDAFITMIKEQNKNASLKIWAGTEAEYNAAAATVGIDDKTIYYIKTGANTVIKNPVRGVDYWTAADQAAVVNAVVENFINASEVAM